MRTPESLPSLTEQVIDFVARHRAVPLARVTLRTTLFGDLGTDGDDGLDLLNDFCHEFSVDMAGCGPSRYFTPEAQTPLESIGRLVSARELGTPEGRNSLEPLSVGDLVRIAERGRWSGS